MEMSIPRALVERLPRSPAARIALAWTAALVACMLGGWLLMLEVEWVAGAVLLALFVPLSLFATGLTGYYTLRLVGRGAKVSARTAVAANERYQARADRRYGRPPYRFNPPPGWPTPKRDWMPPPGWEPDRTLPAIPPGWQLWRRTTPRPAPPKRKSVWAADPAAARTEDQYSPVWFERQSRSVDGLRSLRKTAVDFVQLALNEQVQFEGIDRSQVQGRSRWHPLDWAYGRACDDLLVAAEGMERELRAAIDLGGDLERGAGGRFRAMLASVDELVAAKAEWAGVDREAVGRSASTGQHVMVRAVSAGIEAWEQAEHVAAAALQQFGFVDAQVTGAGTDRGLDVSGRDVAAQVKYTGTPVGRPAIQQLLGAADDRMPVFFSHSGYTQQAVEEADARGMALFTITLPSSVRTHNGVARLLVRLGSQGLL